MAFLRPAERSDDESIWKLFQAATRPGDAFVFAPETPHDVALQYWFQTGSFSYVAEIAGSVTGAYMLKPNQPGLGAHIANGAYMVDPAVRGHGLGRALGEHSLREAKKRGYRALQFNAVVATNEPAVRLWTGLGFRVVGALPGAFHHRTLGYVDLLVMFRSLDDIPN